MLKYGGELVTVMVNEIEAEVKPSETKNFTVCMPTSAEVVGETVNMVTPDVFMLVDKVVAGDV